jgi:hypothetical protein
LRLPVARKVRGAAVFLISEERLFGLKRRDLRLGVAERGGKRGHAILRGARRGLGGIEHAVVGAITC